MRAASTDVSPARVRSGSSVDAKVGRAVAGRAAIMSEFMALS